VAEAGQAIAEVASHLDGGEPYAGVATPARTALSLYDAHVDWSPGIQDLEDEHGRDAVMRLVGLGLIAESLCEEGSDEAANAWLDTESGRAALAWFAAVEIVLAFSMEDEAIDGDKLLDLLDGFFDSSIDEWAEFAGDTALARARIIVNNWTDVLCPAITAAAANVGVIAKAVRGALGDGGDVEALVAESESIALYQALVARHLGEMLGGEMAAAESQHLVEPKSVAEEPSVSEPAEVESAEESPVEEVAVAAEPVEEEVADEPVVDLNAERRAQIEEQMVRATSDLAGHSQAVAAAETASEKTGQQLVELDERIVAQAEGHEQAKAALTSARQHRSSYSDGGAADQAALKKAQASAQAAGQELTSTEASSQVAVEHREECLSALKSAEGAVALSRSSVRETQAVYLAGMQEQRRLASAVLGHRQSFMGMIERSGVVIAQRLEQINEQRIHRKTSLASLRKERRGLGKTTATTSRQEKVLESEMDALMAVIDTSRREARRARDHVSECAVGLQASQVSHEKRAQRLQALEVRQADADVQVNTISAQISESRADMDEIVAVITVQRKEFEATRQEALVRLRKEKRLLDQQLDVDRDRIPVLKAATKKMRAQITAVIAEERVAVAARDEAKKHLKSVRTQRSKHEKMRTNEAELAVAALDMLKSNAKRLEEAHSNFSAAQGALDGLYKELKLAGSQRESMDREIQKCREQEVEIQDIIATSEQEKARIEAEITGNLQGIAQAKENKEQARLLRIQALRAQIDQCRTQIEGWRTQIGEAQEDSMGLCAAEKDVGAIQEGLQAECRGLVGQRTLIEKERVQIQKRQAAIVRVCTERESSLALVGADITGAGFTIQGLVADRDGRKKRLEQAEERIKHLQKGVARARIVEDDAVERVADFQSWVNKSQSALERCMADIGRNKGGSTHGRVAPTPPLVPAANSKVDRLLADLKKPKKPKQPETDSDPDATMILGRAALIAQAEADAAATRVLSRTATKAPAEPDEDATVMYSPEELRLRLLAEAEQAAEEDATMIVRRPMKSPASEDE
jgi:hypothetical protein